MKRVVNVVLLGLLGAVLAANPGRADQNTPGAPSSDLNAKVRHKLVTLPFYSIFDDLNYVVEGGTVTLTGEVTRPVLRSDAEAVVKRIPGVASVSNQIEVLPLSDFDNRIRRSVYLTLFHPNSPLFRYSFGADPSIHIIVDNGHVTLKGFVSSKSDKQIAAMYVQQVFGVFSVTNDLNVGKIG
jgi:BON domain-containing protein